MLHGADLFIRLCGLALEPPALLDFLFQRMRADSHKPAKNHAVEKERRNKNRAADDGRRILLPDAPEGPLAQVLVRPELQAFEHLIRSRKVG